MSHCEIIELPVLEIEPYQVTEALRCLVHTILFNRALGTIVPRDVDSGIFDITWVHCGGEDIDRRVEKYLTPIQSWTEKHCGQSAVVSVGFYERVEVAGWFSNHQRQLHWELWRIPISILFPTSDNCSEEQNVLESEAVRARQKAKLQSTLEECLDVILDTTSSKREHLPPVDSRETLTYPFDISLMPSKDSQGSSLLSAATDSLKRILSSTSAPPSVLH